jgi:1,4-dihydroxy-2-naphthoate polyprenyltransferase
VTPFSVWLEAFRLRTLPLALSCILMGSFLAASAGAFRWDVFLLCILTTIFLQILSNLANDYGDSVHGADSLERKGPARAVQSGAITRGVMLRAVILFVILSFTSGVTLLLIAFASDWMKIATFLGLGILSIIAAVAYTVGKRPYGYAGLGDISVLIFFGFVGVMGSCYLFTKTWDITQLLPAASCGFFSMAVLNINNIRDIESDKGAGKYSVPVRLGRRRAVIYHWLLLVCGVACATIYTAMNFHFYAQLLFLLTIPLFIKNGMAVQREPSQKLDPYLKQMALSTLAFVLTFGIGLLLS